MRTTLTLDDDVAESLHRLLRKRGGSLKLRVNEALRAGLRAIDPPPAPRQAVRTEGMDLGNCLVGSLDNVSEVLAMVEGGARR